MLSESHATETWKEFREYLNGMKPCINDKKEVFKKFQRKLSTVSRKSASEILAQMPVLNNVIKASVQKKIETPSEMPSIQERVKTKVVQTVQIQVPKKPQQEVKPSVDDTIEFTREEAWGALLESTVNGKHITKHKLEDIQTKLHKAGIPYDATTNTIIKSIQKDEPEIQGTDILDMNNPKTEEAFVETIPKLIEGE